MHFDGEDYCYMEGHMYRDGEWTCTRCGHDNEPLRRYLQRHAMWSVREYFRPFIWLWTRITGK